MGSAVSGYDDSRPNSAESEGGRQWPKMPNMPKIPKMHLPSLELDSGWGEVEQEKDEELFQPIKNFSGEVIGWKERTASDKLRRKR